MQRPLLTLLLTLLAGLARAGDGDLTWRTISTPHFEIHFPLELEAIATRTARLCEEAHATLAPLHRYTPQGVIQVVVTDYGDSANGSATAIPQKKIQVYAAPPAIDGNLNDYDDWLRLLIFHEYTHILQLDQIRGVPAFINQLFGRHFAPNHNLPSFVLEGGAVWVESLTSSRGRIRSAIFRGFLRAQALEGSLHDVDAVVHAPRRWPGANAWYMYGGHFTAWLVDLYGVEALNQVYRAMSDEVVPFSLNHAYREATGRTFVDLYDLWRADLTRKSHAEAMAVRREGESRLAWLTETGNTHKRPRFGPDGALYSYDHDEETLPGVYRRRGGAAPERILDGGGTDSFDVCGDHLVFSRGGAWAGAYAFHDLYLRPLEGGVERRLTYGGRLRAPACGPDGRWVAATQIIEGRTRLVRVSLVDGRAEVLFDPGGINQVAHPTVHPKTGAVAFLHISERLRDLQVLAPDGALTRLTADDALELHPSYSPDGEWLLFASDRTGIFDVYGFKRGDGTLHRFSHTIAGVVSPALSAEGRLVAQGVRPLGYDLVEIEGAAPHPAGPLARPMPPAPGRPDVGGDPLPHRAYAPTETIWPLSWAPAFSFSNATESANALGLEISTNDAAAHHILNGGISGVPEEEAVEAHLVYSYLRHAIQPSLNLSHVTRTRANGALFGDAYQPWREKVSQGGVGFSLPLSRGLFSGAFSARYQLVDVRPSDNIAPIHDPLDVAPIIPEPERLASLSAGVSFSHNSSPVNAISATRGWRASASLRLRDPRLGGDLKSAEMFMDLSAFLPTWGRHVLAARVNGALGRGDSGQRMFYALSPPERRNLFLDMLDDILYGANHLRGYPAGAVFGDRFVLGTAEYRVPIADVFGGPSTIPIFLRSLKLALFTDWAQGSDEPMSLSPSKFRRSVGAELVTQATFGWRKAWDSRIGYAEGLDEEGETQIYFFLGHWF